MLKAIPKDYHDPSKGTLKLLWEEEWRALGITQVRGHHTTNSGTSTNYLSFRVLGGNIMKFMSPSHTYFSSSESSLFRYIILC